MKHTKYLMAIVLMLTLVFGSSLAAYAFEISFPIASNPSAGGSLSGYVDEDGVTAHLSVTTVNVGYRFLRWQIWDGANWNHLAYSANYDFTIAQDTTVRGVFDFVFNMNVTVNGTGGYTIINMSNGEEHYGYPLPGEYAGDEVLRITPNPGVGYHFVNGIYDGVSSTDVPYLFTMPERDVEIVLNFAPHDTPTTEPVTDPTEPTTAPITEPTTAPTTAPATVATTEDDDDTPTAPSIIPTTEPAAETITTEPVPLAAPVFVDIDQFLDPEAGSIDIDRFLEDIPMEDVPMDEEVIDEVTDEEVPLADALPATGQFSVDYFYGIGGLISGLGLWLKRRK